MIARKLAAAAAFLSLIWASSALAAPAALKNDLVHAPGAVTFGDLFEGAGAASATPVATMGGSTLVLDAEAVALQARRAGIDWSNPNGLARITIHAGAASGAASPEAVPASVAAPAKGVDVLVYAASLNAGDVIRAEDLSWAKLAAAPADAPRDADALIGKVAKRPLRAGSAVASHDAASPQVIKSGDLVDVSWVSGAVSVKIQAKAMASAAVGDMLSLQNPSSKKIIQATATGPGQAITGPSAVTQLASR